MFRWVECSSGMEYGGQMDPNLTRQFYVSGGKEDNGSALISGGGGIWSEAMEAWV